ncbi:hypothetical protein LIER_07458 [Lithospermum erythrorhizon]|uniref:Uncharacterized protein n=1 Tax=Lithospermum erythrorhizon TaxID=34254 RepID=A0AAV3PB03_LITER
MAAPNTHKNSLRSALEKCNLNTSNFDTWSRNLRIVLKQERTEYVPNTKVPSRPNDTETYRNVSNELAIDLILKYLPKKFSQFVMNFNMHKFELSLNKLHKMITNAEANLAKAKTPTSSVLVVQNKKKFKKKFSGKAKGSSKPKVAKTVCKGTAERRTSVITVET